MLRGFSVPDGKYYLVDGGYANTPSFLASYCGVRYHLKEFGRGQQRPRNYKELFNHRHAILRNHIERAIGVLKKRFPILKVGTHHPIENQVKIPAAAVVFHDLIRMLDGDEGWLNHQESNISPEHFVDVPEGDNHYSNDVMSLKLLKLMSLNLLNFMSLGLLKLLSHNLLKLMSQLYMGEEEENFSFDSSVHNVVHNVEADDDDLRILEQPVANDATARSRLGKRVASTRNKDKPTSEKTKKDTQRRRQDGKMVEIMERFIELKEKQSEAEVAQQEKARTSANEEFSIPKCISVVDSMEELSDDQKVLAYDVFKDAQNRSIFMSAKASTRLKWLRNKIIDI